MHSLFFLLCRGAVSYLPYKCTSTVCRNMGVFNCKSKNLLAWLCLWFVDACASRIDERRSILHGMIMCTLPVYTSERMDLFVAG